MPTTPSVTVTVDVVPVLLTTLTLESPAAVVVMAAAGTYNASAADDFVVMATWADWPRRSPGGIVLNVTVVGKVTTELLAVPVGAIAVTVAAAVTPVIAGKVTVAVWPTVTAAISASAMLADTVIAETSAIVANPVDDELEPDALGLGGSGVRT